MLNDETTFRLRNRTAVTKPGRSPSSRPDEVRCEVVSDIASDAASDMAGKMCKVVTKMVTSVRAEIDAAGGFSLHAFLVELNEGAGGTPPPGIELDP